MLFSTIIKSVGPFDPVPRRRHPLSREFNSRPETISCLDSLPRSNPEIEKVFGKTEARIGFSQSRTWLRNSQDLRKVLSDNSLGFLQRSFIM